jgi:hypothetical protein
VLRPLQVVVIVMRGFFQDQCLLRASALTYTTLLALVPMLAFMFAFLKGLGVRNLLEPLLIDKLSVGSEETVRLMREILGTMVDEKLVVEAADAREHYVPGRDPSTITPWDILHTLRHHGDTAMEDLIELRDSRATTLLMQVQDAAQRTAGTRSISQWLAEQDPTSET